MGHLGDCGIWRVKRQHQAGPALKVWEKPFSKRGIATVSFVLRITLELVWSFSLFLEGTQSRP